MIGASACSASPAHVSRVVRTEVEGAGLRACVITVGVWVRGMLVMTEPSGAIFFFFHAVLHKSMKTTPTTPPLTHVLATLVSVSMCVCVYWCVSEVWLCAWSGLGILGSARRCASLENTFLQNPKYPPDP